MENPESTLHTYLMLHHHKFGTSHYLFRSKEQIFMADEDECSGLYTEYLDDFQHIFDALGADVEEDKGETVEFIWISNDKIIEIPPKK